MRRSDTDEEDTDLMRGFAFVSKAPHTQAPTSLAFTSISCQADCWDRGLCFGASFACLAAPPGSDRLGRAVCATSVCILSAMNLLCVSLCTLCVCKVRSCHATTMSSSATQRCGDWGFAGRSCILCRSDLLYHRLMIISVLHIGRTEHNASHSNIA